MTASADYMGMWSEREETRIFEAAYMGRVWEAFNELFEWYFADRKSTVCIDTVHLGILEMRRVLAAFVRGTEPVLYPTVSVRTQLRLQEHNHAEWDEEDGTHDVAVHLMKG